MPKIKTIDFNQISSIPQLIKDFLNNDLSEDMNQNFDLESIEKHIKLKKSSYTDSQRKVLCEVMTRQMSDFSLSDKQKQNLELLSQENTFTIVTGHQLNLFSGPAFFVYKILQIIKTSEILTSKLNGYNIIPVFWMATEDHDFEEINNFRDQENFYSTYEQSGGAVGRIEITSNSFVEFFEKNYKDDPYGEELITLLKKAYKIGNTFTQAIQIVVQELFADRGLLFIDGDCRELKAQIKDVFKDEICNQSLYHCTKDKVEFLREKYKKVQVNPREINLFYLSESRNRIDFNNGIYPIDSSKKVFSQQEILSELDEFPERFSPNALMRPVYQEKILPNLAYVGGNAEIMYWLELKDYFKKINIPFPFLIPRNSMLFLKQKTLDKIQKLGLRLEDFFDNYHKIINQKLLDNNELIDLLDKKHDDIKNSFEEISSLAYKTDKTFENLVKAEEVRQLKSYKRMMKRLLRAERIKQSEKVEQLQRLFLEVNPNGLWQERQYNFSTFYRLKGKAWLQDSYENIFVDKSSLILMKE